MKKCPKCENRKAVERRLKKGMTVSKITVWISKTKCYDVTVVRDGEIIAQWSELDE